MNNQPTPPPSDFAWYRGRSAQLGGVLRAACTAPITRVEFELRLSALNNRLSLVEQAFELDVAPVCADHAALKAAVDEAGYQAVSIR